MAKTSKQRQCPAVGREILPAECGENRVSHYACPADCAHNPFAPANYVAFLEVERRAEEKAVAWLKKNTPDLPALERGIEQAIRSRSYTRLTALLSWQMYFQRDREGRTVAERWIAQGFPGLNNDERVVLRARTRMRTTLIEVRRVLDECRLEVVDLFTAEKTPFIIQDKATASVAVRFVPFLCSVYPLAHYSRPCGGMVQIQEMEPWDPVEIITEQVRHLDGPTESPQIGLWLAEHFMRFEQALTATALARRRKIMTSMDARFGKVVYELRTPFGPARAVLDATAGVLPEPPNSGEKNEGFVEARVWLDDEEGAVKPAPGTFTVLGRVLLGQSHWRLEATGAARLARIRARFEERMGERVRFAAERVEDVGAQFAAKEPPFDESLVATRLLEQAAQLVMSTSIVKVASTAKSTAQLDADYAAADERRFPDSPIPGLDGRTPREAARDPALRPKLARMLKARVRSHDEKNLRTGRADDINWLLRELGMDEILFEPPPRRAPVAEGDGPYNDTPPDDPS